MKLSDSQIEHIYEVLRKKDIHYIALQDELVDHIATGIEVQLSENPGVGFNKAFHNEYRKFGIFGFDGLKMDKEEALAKKAFYDFVKHFLKFFTLPKILLTVSLFLFYKYLIEHFNENIMSIFYHVKMIFVLFSGVFGSFYKFKQLRINASKYLYAHSYTKISYVSYFIGYILYFTPAHDIETIIISSPSIASGLFTAMLIHMLVHYELNVKLNKSFQEKFKSEIA